MRRGKKRDRRGKGDKKGGAHTLIDLCGVVLRRSYAGAFLTLKEY